MEIVYFGDRNARNRALLVSNKEWTRLGKILTEKAAKVDALETCKRLRERRRETSKKMANDWDNTELNKTKKILEQKRKALTELEAEQKRRDEEMKREMLVARDRVVDRARKLKFEERDATKTFNRAIRLSEVFKERAIQLKFNEDARNKRNEKNLMEVREQNAEADQYKKQQMNERQKNNELKKNEAKILLKELKDREDRRRDDQIKRHESDQEELRKIAEEIEHTRKYEIAEAQAAKDKLLKNIKDNQILTVKKKEERWAEDLEEDMVTSVMANTKKLLARMRKSKELELMEDKLKALEDIRTKVAVWPVKETGWAESDIKKSIKTEEQRYQNGQRKRKELANKRMEYVEIGKRLWEDEKARRHRILVQEHILETERRNREKKLLIEFAELRRRMQEKNAQKFCEQLDTQCNDKAAVLLVDRQDDIDRHQAFERQWQKEDKEFIDYAKKVIEENKLRGDPIVPLNKVVKDYLKKNNLYMDQKNNVLKKLPKGPVNMSRIIQH